MLRDELSVRKRVSIYQAPPLVDLVPRPQEVVLRRIPCVYLPKPISHSYDAFSNNSLLIYFHANGEDIFHCLPLTSFLRGYLNLAVLTIEYPGYSLYPSRPGDREAQIYQDSLHVYDYLVGQCGVTPEQIVLLGRSLGSGPAAYLAQHRQVQALVLLAGFTSIRAVVSDFAGAFLGGLVKESFQNREKMAGLKSNVLFVHGAKDDVVHSRHSQQLYEECVQENCWLKQLFISSSMTHSVFDFEQDLAAPVLAFLEQIGLMDQNHPPLLIE